MMTKIQKIILIFILVVAVFSFSISGIQRFFIEDNLDHARFVLDFEIGFLVLGFLGAIFAAGNAVLQLVSRKWKSFLLSGGLVVLALFVYVVTILIDPSILGAT